MKVRITSVINCNLEPQMTKAVRTDGTFVFPETHCEEADGEISLYVRGVNPATGTYDAICGENNCVKNSRGGSERLT